MVESIYQNVCNIQDAESEEYSNPASKLCSKLPDCVDVFTLQYLNIILQSYHQLPHFMTTTLEVIGTYSSVGAMETPHSGNVSPWKCLKKTDS